MKKTPLENWIIKRTGISPANPDALKSYQLKKLVETLSYAKDNSRFYQNQLEGIDPRKIKSWDQFERLPFTTAEDIKNNPFDFLCVPQSQIARIVTLNTSGTSGPKKRIFFTEADLQKTVDFFDYGICSLIDNTDRVMVLLPGQAYGTIGDLLKKALDRTGTPCVVYGLLNDLEAVEKTMIENEINCIVGIPIQVLYLSRSKAASFNRIEKVLLSTDYVPQALVFELNQKFGCQVFNHYGMTEMGYGGGVECQALNGYHLREGDLYFEIVDPRSGKKVADGITGEIVFTTFNRQAMPLIRYRTGDLGAFSVDACQCGSFLRIMKKVDGRLKNRIQINGDVTFDLKELEEILLADEDLIDYQVTIKDDQTLLIEVSLYQYETSKAKEAQLQRCIETHFLKNHGEVMQIEVKRSPLQKPDQLVNSMVKRKIRDWRKEISCE
ncbi:DVU_1553 family AMP-dependent CoA ligase [Acetobacterium wieringae]|uniref:DVU_1553 family AMP-dependent CoA ligase n=1 Tax=Acetobacterium wieringae TaxID=52694 RepID=UPI0026F02BC2|nr:AMP-binding protein [Acetobacterium wieringae]